MKRAIAIFGLLALSCHHSHKDPPGGGGTKPGDVIPPPPPREKRMSLSELRQRQADAARRIQFAHQDAYAAPKIAADVAKGGEWRMGALVNYQDYFGACIMPAYVFKHGSQAEKAKAKQYCREWLANERTADWRKGSMVCSLNHQACRQIGIHLAVQVLGVQEALRYGDPVKVREHEQRAIDIIVGLRWYGADGSAIPADNKCHGGQSAGKHPEGYRSRHYWSRAIGPVLAAADCGSDKVRAAALPVLDVWWANLERCIGDDGLWRPERSGCEDFRADTGTRCPQVCPERWRPHRLNCHPEESQVIAWIMKPGVEWRPEFSDRDCENPYFHYSPILYIFGENWRPLK